MFFCIAIDWIRYGILLSIISSCWDYGMYPMASSQCATTNNKICTETESIQQSLVLFVYLFIHSFFHSALLWCFDESWRFERICRHFILFWFTLMRESEQQLAICFNNDKYDDEKSALLSMRLFFVFAVCIVFMKLYIVATTWSH